MEAWGAGAAVLETLKTSETSPKSSGAGCQLQSRGANGSFSENEGMLPPEK